MTNQSTKRHLERPVAVDIDEEIKHSDLDQKRRLLLAEAKDDVEANDIITIFMGDQVDHRREFLEQNALTLQNRDA